MSDSAARDPGSNGSRLATWRDGLAASTAALLLVAAAGHMFFIVPTYRRLLASIGATVSLPARLAIGLSHAGLALVVLCLAALVVAYWRERRRPSGVFPLALAAAALLAAIYLILVSWVYLDVALVMGRIR